ncbi:MAG: hypothetical protein JJU33_14845 [Phycisphaerales bacterium]|nr:hypothetical protein [Phycisphaerales bacterium]
MSDFIRDYALWTFVAAVLGAMAIVVMVLIYVAQRKNKRLSYEVVSSTQLLGVHAKIQGKVKVLYENSEVKNIHLLILKFVNSGNQSISSSDFEQPLSIAMNSGATILTYEVVGESPENLEAMFVQKENAMVLSPLLLNPGDSFSVTALVSDLEGQPVVCGRINGVKAILNADEGHWPSLVYVASSCVFAAVGVVFAAVGKDEVLFSLFGRAVSVRGVGVILIGAGYVMMCAAALRSSRTRNLMQEILSVTAGFYIRKL